MVDLEVRVSEPIAAPAGVVWGLIADFGALGDWWPPGQIESVEVEGAGIGMVRCLRSTIGIALRERLEALDDDERRIETSMTGDLPVGMCEYRATGRVIARGADACTIEWLGRCSVPDRGAAAAGSDFVEGICALTIRGIRERVAALREPLRMSDEETG